MGVFERDKSQSYPASQISLVEETTLC